MSGIIAMIISEKKMSLCESSAVGYELPSGERVER